MKRSNRLILLIGLFLAVVAFVGVIMLTGNTSSGGGTVAGPSPSPTTAKVVKATVDIPAGTSLQWWRLQRLVPAQHGRTVQVVHQSRRTRWFLVWELLDLL